MPPRPAFLQRSCLTLQVRAYKCTCPDITMSTSCSRNRSSKISYTLPIPIRVILDARQLLTSDGLTWIRLQAHGWFATPQLLSLGGNRGAEGTMLTNNSLSSSKGCQARGRRGCQQAKCKETGVAEGGNACLQVAADYAVGLVRVRHIHGTVHPHQQPRRHTAIHALQLSLQPLHHCPDVDQAGIVAARTFSWLMLVEAVYMSQVRVGDTSLTLLHVIPNTEQKSNNHAGWRYQGVDLGGTSRWGDLLRRSCSVEMMVKCTEP